MANFAANETPDLVEESAWTQEFAAAGHVLSLEKFIEQDGEEFGFPEDWQPRTITRNSVDDEIFGVQLHLTCTLPFYNMSVLEKAGIKKEDLPTTWEEFLAVCQAVTTETGLHGFAVNQRYEESFPWFFQNEVRLYDPETNTVPMDNEDAYEALQFQTDLIHDIRRTPLMIRLPQQTNGHHLEALVQGPDLMPTILEMAGLVATETIGGQTQTQALQCGVFYTEAWAFEPETIHAKSLMPLIRGETDKHRDIAVCSTTLIHHTPILAKSAIITADGWCLHYAGKYDDQVRDAAMFISKLTDPDIQQAPTEPGLFYLPDDPDEGKDLIGSNEQLTAEIHQRYVTWLEEAGTPEEHLAGRRSLR